MIVIETADIYNRMNFSIRTLEKNQIKLVAHAVAKHRDWQDGLMHRQPWVWSSPIAKFAYRSSNKRAFG